MESKPLQPSVAPGAIVPGTPPPIDTAAFEAAVAQAIATHVEIAEAEAMDAAGFVIDSPAMRDVADTMFKGAKDRCTTFTEERLNFTRPLDDSKKRIMAVYAPLLTALTTTANQLGAKILAYDAAEEATRKAAEKLAQEQADAEAKRLRDEAALEAARLRGAAADLAKEGDQEGARKLDEKAAQVVAEVPHTHVPIVLGSPRAKGSSSARGVWGATVTDKKAMVEHILKNWDSLGYLILANESGLNAMARQVKGASTIPGVSFDESKTLAKGRG